MNTQNQNYKKQLVYDVPTRLFHVLFAFYFIFSFSIAKYVDDESITYAYHMMGGMVMALLIVLRLIWSIVNNQYNQIKDLTLQPKSLLKYAKQYLKKIKWSYPGHNPASSSAAFVMMLLTIGLVTSGLLMTGFGQKKNLEDIHEIMANLFLLIVIGHVLGVILHTMRFKDWLPLSMITGNKKVEQAQLPQNPNSVKNYTWVGVLMLIIIFTFVMQLSKHMNLSTGQLKIFNKVFQLVDIESNEPMNENEKTESE